MSNNVYFNKQVEWYADHSWFKRFSTADKFLNNGQKNQALAKARVRHLVAAIWDLQRKKDLLVDTLQKATYPYAVEKTMPQRLMQVYNVYSSHSAI